MYVKTYRCLTYRKAVAEAVRFDVEINSSVRVMSTDGIHSTEGMTLYLSFTVYTTVSIPADRHMLTTVNFSIQ